MHGGLPDLPQGNEGIWELFKHFGQIEQEWSIEDVIAEEDKVVVPGVNTCKTVSWV